MLTGGWRDQGGGRPLGPVLGSGGQERAGGLHLGNTAEVPESSTWSKTEETKPEKLEV